MNTPQQPFLRTEEIEASLYRPYKRWSTPGFTPLNVILAKREDADCIAACPVLGLRIDSNDYLEASFELASQIRDKLEIPPGAIFTSTCVTPFDPETGNTLAPSESTKVPNITTSAPDRDEISNKPVEQSASIEMSDEHEDDNQPDLFG